jgi:hypothetical protein
MSCTAFQCCFQNLRRYVTEIIREKGTDAWWEMELVDLLPPEHRDKAESLVKVGQCRLTL